MKMALGAWVSLGSVAVLGTSQPMLVRHYGLVVEAGLTLVHRPDRCDLDPGGVTVKGARQGITCDARSAPLTVSLHGSRLERPEDGVPQVSGSWPSWR
jgi:hypothetical protein